MRVKSSLSIVAVLVSLLVVGCQDIKKDIKKSKSDLETAKSNTIRNLNRIQQHGAVDLEVRLEFDEVFQAYSKFIQTKQRPPRSWYDLESVAKSPSLLQEVQRRGVEIVFGVSLGEARDPGETPRLFLIENSAKTAGGWGMNTEGVIQKLTPAILKEIGMANADAQ